MYGSMCLYPEHDVQKLPYLYYSEGIIVNDILDCIACLLIYLLAEGIAANLATLKFVTHHTLKVEV